MTRLRNEFLDWVKTQPKKSHRQMAKEFGINKDTVSKYLKAAKDPDLHESKMDQRNKYKNIMRLMLDANGVKCGKQRFDLFKWRHVPGSGKTIDQIYDELIHHINGELKKSRDAYAIEKLKEEDHRFKRHCEMMLLITKLSESLEWSVSYPSGAIRKEYLSVGEWKITLSSSLQGDYKRIKSIDGDGFCNATIESIEWIEDMISLITSFAEKQNVKLK